MDYAEHEVSSAERDGIRYKNRCKPTTEEPMSHTPGPWHAKLGKFDHLNDGSRPIMDATEENRVALANSMRPRKRNTPYNAPDPERDANARLIAAAPEMLEMLKRCRSIIDQYVGDKADDMISMIDGVIAKAEQ